MHGDGRRPGRARIGHNGTLGAALRLGTAADHVAIERNPRFARLLAPDLRREDYAALLVRLLPFHDAAEAGFARHLSDRPGLALGRRRRAPRLRADLMALGVALPRDPAPDPAPDPDTALGALYVLEGSTLGAKRIRAALALSLGLDAATGAAFFAGHGRETGALWRDLLAALEAEGRARPAAVPAIVAGARRTFAALDAWVRG